MKKSYFFEKFNIFNKRLAALLLAVAVLAVSLAVLTLSNALADDIEYIKVKPLESLNGYDLGVKPDTVSLYDLGWRPGTTVATSTVQRRTTAIGFDRALVTTSSVEEAQGPYNGTPCVAFEMYAPISAKTNTVMMYIKIPTYGTESLDPWPPYDWSIRCNSVRVSQEATNSINLYSIAGDADLHYLDIKTDVWQKTSLDTAGTFKLPSGFEGYIKFDISQFDNWSQWKSSGFDPSKDYKLDSMQFVFGWLGGKYGAFEIGGVYSVLEDSFATNLLLEGEDSPIPMVKSADALVANTVLADLKGEAGDEISTDYVKITDLGYRGGKTAAKAYIAEHTGVIGNNNAIRIKTDVAEGEGPNFATPNVSVRPSMNISALNNIAMFYFELPENASGKTWSVRIRALAAVQDGANGGNYLFSDAQGMKFEYLEADGESWESSTVGGFGSLVLPSGFKGYVKLDLSTATHYNDWISKYGFDKTKNFTLREIDFIFGSLGGEYGDFVVGGIYEVVKDTNGIEIELDGAEKVLMTKVLDRHDATIKYDYSWVNVGDDASATISVGDRNYYQGKTAATAVFAESTHVIGDHKVIRISAPSEEGINLMNTSPYASIFIWCKVDPECNTFIFYMEAPKFEENGNSPWSVRMTSASFQQSGANNNQWLFSDFKDFSYDYLERDGKAWVSKQADGLGNLTLPNGFKGYIKLHLDTLPNYNTWINNNGFDPEKEYSLNSLDFMFGYIGGNYGDFVLGDFYQITRESTTTKMKIDGTVYDMTTYDSDNKKRVEDFTKLVDSINGTDLAAAVIADEANSIYAALADEYKEMLDKNSVEKLKDILKAVEIYRPKYLGVKIKAPDGGAQALKFGAVIDTATALESGYEFVSAGTVAIYELEYSGLGLVTSELEGVSVLETDVTAQDNIVTVTAVMPVENFDDYSKYIIARFYAVYKNIETGEEITVYSGDYTYQNGNTEANFKANVIDTAGYFGVSLFSEES